MLIRQFTDTVPSVLQLPKCSHHSRKTFWDAELQHDSGIASLGVQLNFNLWFHSPAINSVLCMFIVIVPRAILMFFHFNGLIQCVQF